MERGRTGGQLGRHVTLQEIYAEVCRTSHIVWYLLCMCKSYSLANPVTKLLLAVVLCLLNIPLSLSFRCRLPRTSPTRQKTRTSQQREGWLPKEARLQL